MTPIHHHLMTDVGRGRILPENQTNDVCLAKETNKFILYSSSPDEEGLISSESIRRTRFLVRFSR